MKEIVQKIKVHCQDCGRVQLLPDNTVYIEVNEYMFTCNNDKEHTVFISRVSVINGKF